MRKYIESLLRKGIPRVALYKSIVGAIERREVIRRFMLNEPNEINKDITEIIGLALSDTDWEVRVSAMLACVYFGLKDEYGKVVRHLELPKTSRSGLDERERGMLVDIKREALNVLYGAEIPEEPEDINTPENRVLYVRRLVGFQPIGQLTDIRLLFFSLMAPYHYDEDKSRFHPSISKKKDQYFLGDIELVRLPNIKAFLGGEAKNMNQLILAHIPQNMFVSRNIIQQKDLQNIKGYEKSDNTKVPYAVAEALCKDLSFKHNITVEMPDHYLWEYAVRGFNGRKYPWGNSPEKDQPKVIHPYNLVNYIGHGGEWTKTLVNNKYRIMMGNDPELRAGRIQYSTEDFKANLRIAVFGNID